VCRIRFYFRYPFSTLGLLRHKSVSYHTQQNYSPTYVRRVRMVQRFSQGLTVRKLHVVAVGITDDAEIAGIGIQKSGAKLQRARIVATASTASRDGNANPK
jgi:hypothetical protein